MKLEVIFKSEACTPDVVWRGLAILERIAVAVEALAESADDDHVPVEAIFHVGPPVKESNPNG